MNLALFKAILMSSDLNVSKKKTKPLFLAGVLSERKALFSLTILVREAGLEPARPEWTLEPERFRAVLNPVNSVHNVPKNHAFRKIL